MVHAVCICASCSISHRDACMYTCRYACMHICTYVCNNVYAAPPIEMLAPEQTASVFVAWPALPFFANSTMRIHNVYSIAWLLHASSAASVSVAISTRPTTAMLSYYIAYYTASPHRRCSLHAPPLLGLPASHTCIAHLALSSLPLACCTVSQSHPVSLPSTATLLAPPSQAAAAERRLVPRPVH